MSKQTIGEVIEYEGKKGVFLTYPDTLDVAAALMFTISTHREVAEGNRVTAGYIERLRKILRTVEKIND